MNLSNKVALITGGTRMGLAVSQALADKGCEIVLTWRHSRRAVEEAVQTLRASGAKASAVPCNVAKPSAVQSLARTLRQRYGRLDILVHMVSVYDLGPLAKYWRTHMENNLESSFQISQVLGPLLQKAKEARVVMISDWTNASGRPRYKDYGAYYVTKAGIQALVEVLALEWSPSILVNAIAPGPILAPANLTAAEKRAVEKATPVGHWGGPEEIAKAVVFLTETDFVTGETIRVDGGRHLL